MNFNIPHFEDKQQLFDWLKLNKNLLIKQKKSAIKRAEGFGISIHRNDYFKPDVNKEFGVILNDNILKSAKCVINATNIIDSHQDLHIPKMWNKSLKEDKDPLHLQEHQMKYDYVICDGPDEVKSYVATKTWKSLGYDYNGSTELLMHDLTFKGRNNVMEQRYKNGEVKYHSVGMRYINLVFCVNSPEKYWIEEKENFDQYIAMAVNPQAADCGYFWAVLEAQKIEGSAVVR